MCAGNKAGFRQTTDAADTLETNTRSTGEARTEQPLIVAFGQFFVGGSNCTFLALAPRARLQSSSVVGKNTPDAINNRQPQQSQLYSCQRYN